MCPGPDHTNRQPGRAPLKEAPSQIEEGLSSFHLDIVLSKSENAYKPLKTLPHRVPRLGLFGLLRFWIKGFSQGIPEKVEPKDRNHDG